MDFFEKLCCFLVSFCFALQLCAKKTVIYYTCSNSVWLCVTFGLVEKKTQKKQGFKASVLVEGRYDKILEDYIPVNHSWWLLERYTRCKLALIFRVVESVFTHVCLCVEAIGGIFRLKVTVSSVTATFYHLGSLFWCYSVCGLCMFW